VAERGRPFTRAVSTRAGAGQFLVHGRPAEAELAGQLADRPTQTVQGLQFHVGFSRLHAGSPGEAFGPGTPTASQGTPLLTATPNCPALLGTCSDFAISFVQIS